MSFIFIKYNSGLITIDGKTNEKWNQRPRYGNCWLKRNLKMLSGQHFQRTYVFKNPLKCVFADYIRT